MPRNVLPNRRKLKRGAPPRLADLLMYITLPKKSFNCIKGDLTEEYNTVALPEMGSKRANRWYWWEVLRSIGPTLRGEIACARITSNRRNEIMGMFIQDVRY